MMAARRGNIPFVPEPMRASEKLIEKCRAVIDPPWKAALRQPVNFILKTLNGICEMGVGFHLGLNTKIPRGSRLGRYAHIGKGFYSPSPVSVGDLCMISTNVIIVGNDHGTDNVNLPIRLDFRWVHKVTIFESDVWVGHGAILRSGIRVGRGAVIAAGAVVTKDVEPYSIVGGNPARLIRKRFEGSEVSRHDSIIYG